MIRKLHFSKFRRRQLGWKCVTRVSLGLTTVCLLAALILHVNLNKEISKRSVGDTQLQYDGLAGRQLGRDFSLGEYKGSIYCFITLVCFDFYFPRRKYDYFHKVN